MEVKALFPSAFIPLQSHSGWTEFIVVSSEKSWYVAGAEKGDFLRHPLAVKCVPLVGGSSVTAPLPLSLAAHGVQCSCKYCVGLENVQITRQSTNGSSV